MGNPRNHYHAWILQFNDNRVSFESMAGEYASKGTCRRHAYKAAGGDADKVIVLLCRGQEMCPARLEEAALTA